MPPLLTIGISLLGPLTALANGDSSAKDSRSLSVGAGAHLAAVHDQEAHPHFKTSSLVRRHQAHTVSGSGRRHSSRESKFGEVPAHHSKAKKLARSSPTTSPVPSMGYADKGHILLGVSQDRNPTGDDADDDLDDDLGDSTDGKPAGTPGSSVCMATDLVVKNAASPACLEGVVFSSGDTCTPECQRITTDTHEAVPETTDLFPTVPELVCFNGSFQPSSFECAPVRKCHPPSKAKIANAGDTTCEEEEIEHDNLCNPICAKGYVPFVTGPLNFDTLTCDNGTLVPMRFQCLTPEQYGEAKAADKESLEGGKIEKVEEEG